MAIGDSPTIIVGHLKDDELKASINALVSHVAEGTKKMVDNFDSSIEAMKKKLKELENVKVDLSGNISTPQNVKNQKSNADAAKSTANATKESANAAKDYASSLDRAQAALNVAMRTAVKYGRKKFLPIEELDKYAAAIAKVVELENKLKSTKGGGAIVTAMQNERSWAFDAKKLNDFGKASDELKKLNQQYAEAEKLSQKVAAAAKKLSDKEFLAGFRGAMTMPSNTIDEITAKITRLKSILAKSDSKEYKGILSEADINRANSAIGRLNEQLDKQKGKQRAAAEAAQKQAQAAQQYTDEVKRQAKAIRESQQWQKEGWVLVSHPNGGMDAIIRKGNLSIEEQLLQFQKQINREIEQQANAERRATEERQREVHTAQQQLVVEQQVSAEREKQLKKYKQPTTTEVPFRSMLAKVLKQDISTLATFNDKIVDTEKYLKQLRSAFNNLSGLGRVSTFGKQLAEEIRSVEDALRRWRNQSASNVSLDSILGIKTNSLNDITYKIQKLQEYKRNLNLFDPQSSKKTAYELNVVDQEINRLTKDLNKYMSTTRQAIGQNNALTRSWNYMKNRLAFYFTVGASTQFVKNLIEVRSQYEMNERALGILIDSAERGTQIFNELSQMALVSPYTLIELSAAAKQLTAYDIAAKDVVDTTRRLADMASAVGIPIERLTYALGQIKAYGYLNSRDARMFSNAGIPLVKQLADYYTELEGKLVSTADVYDRIKKKTIDFNTVVSVMNKMTDEGGKFFDFQAKMADTLKVRLANLTLAWNNMLNDIGKETQGMLTFGINALKNLFLHWKQLDKLLNQAMWATTIIVGLRTIVFLVNRLQFALGHVNQALPAAYIAGQRIGKILSTIWGSLKTILSSRIAWTAIIGYAIWEAFDNLILNANKATKEFNKSLRETANTDFNDIEQFLNQYKDIRNSLFSSEQENGGRKSRIPQSIDQNEASKAWESLRERIELSTTASDEYIGRLLQINDISERLRQGFTLLDDVNKVNAAFKEITNTTFKVTEDHSKWWNLWRLPDGLIDNIKDYHNAVESVQDAWGSVGAATAANTKESQEDLAKITGAATALSKDLKKFSDSVKDFLETNSLTSPTQIIETYNKATKKLVMDNNLSPQEAFDLQIQIEGEKNKAVKIALANRIADEQRAYNAAEDERVKNSLRTSLDLNIQQYRLYKENTDNELAYWESFTKYMKENHISEMQAMFGKMNEEQLKSINWQDEKYQSFIRHSVESYAKRHKMAYDEAFNHLKNLVNSANAWEIFIKLNITTDATKPIYDLLTEADQNADTAYSKIERLKQGVKDLENKIKDLNNVPAPMRDAKWGDSMTRYTSGLKTAREELSQAEKDFDKATNEDLGHSKKEDSDAKKAANAAKKRQKEEERARRQEESELQKALKDELSLIDKIRSVYKDLTKEGMGHADAIEKSTSGYEETVNEINKTFAKWGIKPLNPKLFAGVANPNEILEMLDSQLKTILATGRAKPSEIKDLQVKIKDLTIDAEKYDLTKITKGLNNELDKLKDEYELAVELDADPEIGGMFMNMFGIDTDALPYTFREAFERANAIAKDALKKLGAETKNFDLMRTDLTPEDGKWLGIDSESNFYQTLSKWQEEFRNMFKKNMDETEKMLDDYVKKYGDYSDKIAEIESDRLTKLKKLNEAYYTDEMKTRPEYIAKLNAIETGARREKGQAMLDEFKNSRLYIEMFENLDYVSTATLETLRNKLSDLKDEMGSLSPEQLKQVTQQFEKIDKELMSRNPFKGIVKNIKDFAKASGKAGREAQKNFATAQENYDAQLQIVAALKEQLEQKKAQHPTDKAGLDTILETLGIEEEKLNKLKEELATAESLNNEYNLMKTLFGEQANAIAKFLQAIAANLEALSELRDTLEQTFSTDFGARIDGTVDSLAKFGQGINQIVSSAQSGNVVGTVTGAVNMVAGFGDTIASIFGNGAARTNRLNREIARSEKTVMELNSAYKELERTVEKSLGSAETSARRLAIANKEAELAELERQLVLEQSKRSKDKNNDAIEDYKERIQDLKFQIEDLKDAVINELLGEDVKSAAEGFVDAWVQAWKAGETTLDAVEEKMDEMIFNLIKKAATSKIVGNLLKPLYDAVDQYTQDGSEGGVALTMNEIKALSSLSKDLSVDINEALGAFYGNLEALGAIEQSGKNLSALQQGIQGITEDQASALEAYWNANTQQQYVQSDLLLQIRDAIAGFDIDVQTASMGQILLQLQASYQVQMSIQGILEGVLTPSGRAFNVELLS